MFLSTHDFWTSLQRHRAHEVKEIVDDLKDYWPLTLRQIHYRLVEKRPDWKKGSVKTSAPYKNQYGHYQDLSNVLKWMRIHEVIPWEALTDRTRRVSEKRGYEDLEDFIDRSIYWFLKGYDRCLVQSQDIYLEIWIEKDTATSIIEDVADPYCLRVVTRRGYNSVTAEADYYRRAQEAIDKGRKPVVLYFGDFDPSGKDMLRASLRTLEEHMGLKQIEVITAALTEDQVQDLPPKPEAAKKRDPRYKGYVSQYGTSAWELEALHPRDLQRIAKEAIENTLDMEMFQTELEREQLDKNKLNGFRDGIVSFLKKEIADFLQVGKS